MVVVGADLSHVLASTSSWTTLHTLVYLIEVLVLYIFRAKAMEETSSVASLPHFQSCRAGARAVCLCGTVGVGEVMILTCAGRSRANTKQFI
jgi:hypothetical protein